MARPNILWISFEDCSPRFGCYGDTVAQTPHVDQLAASGRRYDHAFSTAPVCAPSRHAIITGVEQCWSGAHHMRCGHQDGHTPDLPTPYECVTPPGVRCFSEYLRAQGYHCTNNHKTDYQFSPPLSAWDACHPQAHWRARAPHQPFFAVFNLDATHESGMWAEHGQPATDPATVSLPPYLPDTHESRQALARHYDNIAANDRRVGELLAQLDEDGLSDNTVVVIWSDHGEGLPRANRWPYDSGTRVPLIVHWPGHISGGEVSKQMVSLVDLAPTMLGLAGIEPPAHLHGHDFLKDDRRRYAISSRDRYDESYDCVRSIRDGRFRYIRNLRPDLPRWQWIPYRNRHPISIEISRRLAADSLEGEQAWFGAPTRPVEELYDCTSDPHELRNLANDPAHADDLARLRAALDDWRQRYDRFATVDEAHMVRTWWPDGSQPRTAPVQFVVIDQEASGTHTSSDQASASGPAVVQLYCASESASIVYCCDDDGDEPQWLLYQAPIRLQPGTTRIRARADRIGYQPSAETTITVTVS
ncbi:MAG: sulfatase family protein [Planctomycetota bacterium]|jgi:arylsulfatase A-like enzyme